MTQETLWAREDRSVYGRPWSRVRAIREALGWAIWTERERHQLERISTHLKDRGVHVCHGGPGVRRWCWVCYYSRQIDVQIKEWDRIRQAPPIPSTAQLRNALRRPDRTVRAARLYRDISERSADRWKQVIAAVKPYRTVSVRLKHEKNATDADPALRRLERARARLERIVPDVAYLARTVR